MFATTISMGTIWAGPPTPLQALVVGREASVSKQTHSPGVPGFPEAFEERAGRRWGGHQKQFYCRTESRRADIAAVSARLGTKAGRAQSGREPGSGTQSLEVGRFNYANCFGKLGRPGEIVALQLCAAGRLEYL